MAWIRCEDVQVLWSRVIIWLLTEFCLEIAIASSGIDRSIDSSIIDQRFSGSVYRSAMVARLFREFELFSEDSIAFERIEHVRDDRFVSTIA
jgi:hypothetical protein